MSALNVIMLEDRAFVGVDTSHNIFATGQVFEGCKLLPMASAGVVLAGRGTPALLYHFAMIQTAFLRSMDFDAIAQLWPSAIDSWFQEVHNWYCAIGQEIGSPAKSGQQIVAVGWSNHEGRMGAISFERQDGADRFTVTRVGTELCQPAYDDDLSNLVVPDGQAYMKAVFQAQMRTFRAGKMGELVIGGRMIVGELTRGSVTVTDGGPL